jgi:hypothetical protein
MKKVFRKTALEILPESEPEFNPIQKRIQNIKQFGITIIKMITE